MPTIIQQIRGFFTSPTQILKPLTLSQEPSPLAPTATALTIRGALNAAQTGDVRQLFTLFRDITSGQGHVFSEFTKRKLAILTEPHNVIPVSKKNPDDVKAAEACAEMIRLADNWIDTLTDLLDGCLWPCSVVNKIWIPAQPGESEIPLRYSRFKTVPINWQLLCFHPGYGFGDEVPPDQWEGHVKIYRTDSKGVTMWSWADADYLDRNKYILHRGHTMTRNQDCWGGPLRAILGWWFLAECGRDWFGRFMEKFGSPFPVAKVEANNPTKLAFMKAAIAEAVKIGGMVIDHSDEVQLIAAAASANEAGYQSFLEVCNREMSKIILGQTLSADAQPTGLGSSVGNLHSDVRDDYKKFDRRKLSETVQNQIFADFLKINGIPGRTPTIIWGGLDPEEAKAMGALLVDLKSAGLQPTDDAIPGISEKTGVQVERISLVQPAPEEKPAPPIQLSAPPVYLTFSGGNPNHAPAGSPEGGQFTSADEAGVGSVAQVKSQLAKQSYVKATAEKQRFAEHQETILAKAIGGQTTGDNLPMDVISGKHGIECKTIVEGKNDKITMHPESLARKEKFIKQNKMKGWTVAIDARGKPPTYYSRSGFGSFRLASMTRHENLNDLVKTIKGL